MAAERHALIVGGGSGTRLGSETPKQFLPLDGTPVIVRSIQAFITADAGTRITVVVAEDWMHHFRELVEEWDLPRHTTIVSGGETRFHSVRNGLVAIARADGLVAVHDAARPLVTPELIRRVFDAAEQKGNAVPAVDITETLRRVDGDQSASIHREDFRIVQTPQCFEIGPLSKAYELPYQESFTDCASVMEAAGHKIHLVDGDRGNIKLTTRDDLKLANWYLAFGAGERTGPGEGNLGAAG
jgi:2-C-methyl-D-erythritol 4-phosphate cytidylyltransferase